MAKGLVVLDVDGVVLPGQFIMALARRQGWGVYIPTVVECLFFNLGRMKLETLLARTFGRLRGTPWEEVRGAYREMALSTGAREAIFALKAAGRRVILLSAGTPDELVKDLAARLGGDDGAGIITEVRDGCLTGKVGGELSRSGGKLSHVEREVLSMGVSWGDVVAVGDDPNNLLVMLKAGTSIGYHATYSVRRGAQLLVEDEDLRLIVPPALGEPRTKYPLVRLGGGRSWFREVFRKSLHMTAVLVAFLSPRFPIGMSVALLFAMAGYLVLEFWRLNGASLPLVRFVNRRAMRGSESRESAIAPLTLALGMLFALWCLPQRIGLACILIAAVADSGAAVIGSRWGKIPWTYNRFKTVEGSAVFFVSALVCSLVYVPLPEAMLLAAVSAFLESLPLRDWDNFITPVGTGLIAAFLF
jgi:phosphoserine phosphatase